MAHIEKIKGKNGMVKAYKAVVELTKGEKRKRETKAFYINDDLNKKEAKQKAELWKAEAIVEKSKGRYVESETLTLEKFILKDWLENEKKPHIATTTYDNYRNRINAYIVPELGHIPLQELETFHFIRFFGYLRENGKIRGEGGLSENTLKKIYVVLNSALKKASQWKLIKYNPLQDIDSPQPKDYEAPAMKTKEVKKLLKTAKEDLFMYTFVLFAVLTGMRKSEIMGLEWDDVDLEERTIKISKRFVASQHTEEKTKHENETKRKSSKRLIKMPKKVAAALKKYKTHQLKLRMSLPGEYNEEKEFIFCKPNGDQYYPTTITRKFNKLLDKADLNKKYNIHTLRHTFGTLQSKNGTKLELIQQMMGHATISTTADIYTHPDLEMQDKAGEKLEKAIGI